MENHKITIAVPIYGVEKYIARCANSLFQQSYQNIEYIFVNDCTKDNSIQILKDVIDNYPNRKNQVKIINHKQNRGLGAARNTAVENATGDFIIWVDSDDYIKRETVSLSIKKQIVSDADIVTFDYLEDFGDKVIDHHAVFPNTIEDWKIKTIARQTVTMIWCRLIRLSLYKDYNISVREGNDMGEDYQVITKLFYHANKAVGLNEQLYVYNRANEISYRNSFSVTKTIQSLNSVDIVCTYFKDKEIKFQEAALFGECKTLAMYMKGCARANNYVFSKTLRERMDKIPYTYIKRLEFDHKIVYTIKTFFVLSIIARIMHSIK